MKKRKRTSASGEVAAISGYQAQYEYSACQIFHLMREGALTSVSVANPDAGILDDLVLVSEGFAHATQVKSSTEPPASVSLHTELVQNTLIADIAASWRKLEAVHGVGKVRLRYIFSGYFSSQDRKLNPDESERRPVDSASFAQFLNSSQLTQKSISNSQWGNTFETLRGLCGLDDDFIRFINSLQLVDHAELLKNQISSYPPSERRFPTEIKNLLPTLVTADSQTVWTETELVRLLGWRTPLSQRHLHEFPVPADFQENDATAQHLLKTIASLTRGYVSLIGPPGSGKSTLLQRTLVPTTDFAVVRYLAYVPEHRQGLGRGEPVSFLSDLTVQLAQTGFRRALFADDLASLRTDFLTQLAEASRRFIQSGRKTLIIVDGLDHIPREEKLPISFLSELPSVETIPDGILFVLGTQHFDLAELKGSVRQQAQTEERKVTIQPLSRAAIYALAEAAELSTSVDREDLFDACSGHPLTARYFIEALKGIEIQTDIDKILSHSEGLGRDLKDIYERVWNVLAPNQSARQILGLLARSEKSISLKDIALATSEEAVEEVLGHAGFLLQRSKQARVSIFHNSFRLFVADETSRVFGAPSSAKEEQFNSQLASIAAAASPNDPQHWMQIRYLFRANDLSRVLDVATPEYFRQSLAIFRPTSDIKADLQFAFGAIKPTRNRTELVKFLLVSKEIEYRIEAVREFDLVETFIRLGDLDRAIEAALDGDYNGEGWLELLDVLWERKLYDEARSVFEANEPIDILLESNRIHQFGEENEVREWISRAHRFRPLDRLVALIDGLNETDNSFRTYRDYSIREDMRFNLARGYISDNPTVDIRRFCEKLQISASDAEFFVVEASAKLGASGDRERASDLLGSIDDGSFKSLPDWCRLLAAKTWFRLGNEGAALNAFGSVPVPALSKFKHSYGASDFVSTCREVFELHIFGAKLGFNLVTQAAESDEFYEKIQHKIIELAQIRASVGSAPNEQIINRLRTVLLFLAHGEPVDRYSSSLSSLYSTLGWFAEIILHIAKAQNDETLQNLVHAIENIIEERGNRLAGSESFRLAIATEMYRYDSNQANAQGRINSIFELVRSGRTPQEVVESYKQCAIAFAEVGLPLEAEQCLADMHEHTFGYWLRAKKEPQYSFWIDAYRQACAAQPARAKEFASEFGRFLLGMAETEGDGTAQRVIRDLLLGAAASPPAVAALIERLSNTRLTSWTALVGSALEGIVATSPSLAMVCIEVYCELVIPFASGSEYQFIAAALRATSGVQAEAAVERFIRAINIHCAPSGRKTLLQEILDASPNYAAALKDCIARAEAITNLLSEPDRKKADGDDFLDKGYEAVHSLKQLEKLGDGKGNYAAGLDYSYSRKAAFLIENASVTDILQFASNNPLARGDARFMNAAVRRLLNLGDRTQALVFFSDAERAAYNGHWSQFMGGEKLNLQKLRIELFGHEGREAGWDTLLDELATGRTFGSSLFLNLTDVLEVISKDLPWVDIWEATQLHLSQYREYRLADRVDPIASVESHDSLLGYLIAAAFDLYCPIVTDHARSAALHIARISEGTLAFEDLLERLMLILSGPREAAALVYRSRDVPHLAATLLTFSDKLFLEGDFVCTELANRTRLFFGEAAKLCSSTISGFYQLAVTGALEANDFKMTPGLGTGSRPVWSNDPWTWTAMLKFPFKLVADSTELEMEALRRRCAEFMRLEGGQDAFGPEVESRIRRRLELLELKFSFWRPLPLAAQRAFGKMLNELVEADAIDQRVIPHIWADIGGPSLSGHDLPVEAQPDWIDVGKIPQKKFGGIEHDEWLKAADELLYIPFLADWFLLAEVTTIRVRSWREVYTSVRLCLPEEIMKSDVDETLWSVPHLESIDLLRPLYKPEESVGVCTVVDRHFGDLHENTLTICPYVMRELKWKRRKNPLLIEDEKGDLVARTVRWRNGTDMPLWSETEFYGEGQAVVLSRAGYDAMAKNGGVGFIRRRVIQRIEPEQKIPLERIVSDGQGSLH